MKLSKKLVSVLFIAMTTASLAACGRSAPSSAAPVSPEQATASQQVAEAFPSFQGKDFDGNEVDESLFRENEATLLNFWFNGCSACVNEMPALESFNAKLREKGAELIGVNVEATNDNEAALTAAKEILSKQGVSYRNIYLNGGQDALNYLEKIFSFPTTILIDKNGNIIGQPIVGSIENEKRMEQILKAVDELKNGGEVNTVISGDTAKESADDKMTALLAKENDIFSSHKTLWDRLFAKIQKDKAVQSMDTPYDEFLKTQLEEAKDDFTEEELKTLREDLKKVSEIEQQLQALNKKD